MTTTPNVSLPTFTALPSLPLGDVAILSFYIIVAIYVIFSGVLYYHWSTYAEENRIATITYTVYAILTVPLITILGIISFLIL